MTTKMVINGLLAISLAIVLTGCGCERIGAGHAGVEVDLYGDGKGVQDGALVTGMQWYNPFTTAIYEVPTYVQNAVYTADETEGSPTNEEFQITTKDGLNVTFDVSLNFRTPDSSVVRIFKKYRKLPDELTKTVIRNYMRGAFNKAGTQFSAEQLYEKRALFLEISDSLVRSILVPEGFEVEQVTILNSLRLPKSVADNIEAKVNATQLAIKKQQELEQTKADANKAVAEAEGYAKSVLIKARADASANQLLSASLTQQLIQLKFIESGVTLPTTLVTGGDGKFILPMPTVK